MRIKKMTILLVLLSCATVQAQNDTYRPIVSQSSQDSVSQIKVENNSTIIEEEPEPSTPKGSKERRAKNLRYNLEGRNLTVHDPEGEHFFAHVWPRVDFIPSAQSAVVVTGTIIKAQPYLSEDHSCIYTEIAVQVEEVLKYDSKNRFSPLNTLVIDRPGGTLKLRSGQMVSDDIQIEGLGELCFKRRYVLFAERIHDGSDLSLIKSYELREGQVFTNDSRVSRLISILPGVPEAWAHEAIFIKAICQEGHAARKSPK